MDSFYTESTRGLLNNPAAKESPREVSFKIGYGTAGGALIGTLGGIGVAALADTLLRPMASNFPVLRVVLPGLAGLISCAAAGSFFDNAQPAWYDLTATSGRGEISRRPY